MRAVTSVVGIVIGTIGLLAALAVATIAGRAVAAETGTTLSLIGIVVVAEAALIVGLVLAARRDRDTRRQLEARVRFEQTRSELSIALATAAPAAIDAAVDDALTRVAVALGVDGVWRWQPRADEARWDWPLLRAGQPAQFSGPADLPPAVRAQLGEAGAAPCSALAVPLMSADAFCGALFAVSRDAAAAGRLPAGELQAVAAIVASIVPRKRAEQALVESVRLKGAILDSLPAPIAVLDREGEIIAVNHAWTALGRAEGVVAAPEIVPGTSRLRGVQEVADASGGSAEALRHIERACRGERSICDVEYRRVSSGTPHWFAMTAVPLVGREGGAVVAHWDITARKLEELAIKDSEGRFRRMADALPVAIWMSDADGGCTYLNKEWLQLTGRHLEDQRGDAWLESVHADERSACLDAYRRAFRLREGFRVEYRVRRHDGEYRWLLDTGVPQYGSDDAFHGYVGGRLDITERKEAERMLRNLSRRLMLAQDEERRRIARELHDHLSQQLALLAIDLQTLASESSRGEPSAAALQDAWRRTTEIASDVHAISHRLHPSKMEALGLVATVRTYCRDVSRQSLAVHFHQQNVPDEIPPDRALSMFRVLEEALANVIRHSGAAQARVTLVGADASVVLRVSDDGRGFVVAAKPTAGLGLVSMRERLQLLGGTLTITSVSGRGTIVEARVPLTSHEGRSLVDLAPSARQPAALPSAVGSRRAEPA